MCRMSEQTNEHIPALTLPWRMKMALGPMHANEMADALEVHRATVGRWLSGKGTPPRSVFVKQWALITRTDPTWLLTGRPSAPNVPTGAYRARTRTLFALPIAS